MKRPLYIGGIILVVFIALVVIGRANNTTSNSVGNLSSITTDTLIDYLGNEVDLSSYAGKPLVVNSWAVWCPFCREELPDFGALQEEYDDVVVIAINRQESLSKAKGYTDGLDITDEMVFLLDPSDSFYKSIGGFSMPETLFIDRGGNIVVHKRGFMTLKEMRVHTEKIIGLNENI